MKKRYLYTFEAKEIQKFILQSDKLKEMIGGSKIVSQLCDGFLKKSLTSLGIRDQDDYTIIANAAGWARIIFESEEKMKSFFVYWPLLAAQFAPGLQVIQGVAGFDKDEEIPLAIDAVNKQLRRERNVIMRSLPEVIPLIERNPRTGLAAIKADKHLGKLDRQAVRKHDDVSNSLVVSGQIEKGDDQVWPKQFDDIVDNNSSYLAIIHADGNDLGSTLIKLKEHVKTHTINALKVYKDFSDVIAESTLKAAQSAFDEVLKPAATNFIPARPIVLGGDDLTILVRADLAFDFTTHFLREFEVQSANLLQEKLKDIEHLPDKLTACAGIAFIKKAYPFVHGYELAESLCDYTKLIAKGKKYKVNGDKSNVEYIPSSLTFHRNTSSITGNFSEVQKKELTSRDDKVKLWFGPYAVAEGTGGLTEYKYLDALAEALRRLPKGSMRRLIADLYIDTNQAETRFNRILQVAKDDANMSLMTALKALIPDSVSPYLNDTCHTPLYDAHTLNNLISAPEEESDDNG